MKIFRFHWDCGRMGDVEATFAATQEKVDAAIGKKVSFGEILGKHSDISGTLSEDDFTVLTNNQDFIAKVVESGLVPTGHNPLDYIED